VGEKYMGEKSVGEKSFEENRGRWDAGFRFPPSQVSSKLLVLSLKTGKIAPQQCGCGRW